MPQKLVVIGGGAAGFFAAVNAARLNPSLHVVLLEKTTKLLSKVKVSGGGRCNVTHACFSVSEMVKRYPRGAGFLKKAFHEFFTTHTVEWFEQRGVALKTESDGRMFPVSNDSQSIIDCLVAEMNRYGIEVLLKAEVARVQQQSEEFTITLADDRAMKADYVCICCGGFPVIAKFDWLARQGIDIVDPVPSLFTFNMPGNPVRDLMGVTVDQTMIKIAGTKYEEKGPLLITHWGMSGPVILRLSAWAARDLARLDYQFLILVNWAPAFNEQTLREEFTRIRFCIASQKISNRNPFSLPQRLWDYLLTFCGIPLETRWADLPGKAQNKLIKAISAQEFRVQGKTTFKEEFVTAGGVDLAAVDPDTMMSRYIPGLYFAGEVLDIDGITGGYNFQAAWTTGFIAAQAISARSVDREEVIRRSTGGGN